MEMQNKKTILGFTMLLFMSASCSTTHRLVSIERSRILVDSRYDTPQDTEAMDFLAPYKAQVDSMMSPVVGKAAHDMAARQPESDLSNLLSDILMWSGERFGEKPDFAVYNMGGIRAALSEGNVTKGDILDVAPFENRVCFLTLTGDKVEQLFEEVAACGGQGVSHGVNLVITHDRKLQSALLGGKAIEADKRYRIATLDYLAQGNDGLTVFKYKTDTVTPSEEGCNARDIIEDYFRQAAMNGEEVSSRVEGRIVVEQ